MTRESKPGTPMTIDPKPDNTADEPSDAGLEQVYINAVRLSKIANSSVSIEHEGTTYTVKPHRLGKKVTDLQSQLTAAQQEKNFCLGRIKELESELRECLAHSDFGWSELVKEKQEIERLRRALGMAETEMRYAGWSEYDSENVGRVEAYKAAQQALRDKAGA